MTLLKAIMTKDVITTGPEAPVLEALKLMDRDKTSCAVICEDRVPVGMITAGDFIGLAVAERSGSWSDIRVADLMSSPVITLKADDPIECAADLTERCQIRRIPVVDTSGQLVGMVTHADLLRIYVERMYRGSRELGSLHVVPNKYQRGATRRELHAPVEFKTDGEVGRGTIWDLSVSGMQIAGSDSPPLPGTELLLSFAFDTVPSKIELRGEVVRETETGFAVRFLCVGDHERDVLLKALSAVDEGGG